MILLYPDTEQDFDTNGFGALADCISCQVTEERNGIYELQMEYPLDGIHYSEIASRCIVFAKPNPYSDPQPFRIYRIARPLSGRVAVYAQHLSYDLSGIPVSPFTASSVVDAFSKFETQAAVENPFSFWTDKTTQAAFAAGVPSSIRSLLGGSQGSVLDVYGGEYEFDRWLVRLWNQRGQDSGVTIRYGKNLTDLQQEENITNVATGVYPYWLSAGEDAVLVELPEKIVNAPGTYNFTRIIPLDLTAEFQEQPTVDQLRDRAEAYVEQNNIGVPSVSLTVAFQPLDQTEEYKDLALLERVNLCDTVTVEYPELGVSAKAKCIRTVYDVLKDRYVSIELGDARTNIADTILSQEQQIEEKPSTSYLQQAIGNATERITGNKGGYVVLRDVNGDGEPDEILVMNTPDVSTATKVWRWNNAGLGYSSDGYNGPYTTAITQDGAIVADFITTGILTANLIKAGILSDKTGNFSLNMDTGELNMKSGTFSGNVSGATINTTKNAYVGNDLYIGDQENPNISKQIIFTNGINIDFSENAVRIRVNNAVLMVSSSGSVSFAVDGHSIFYSYPPEGFIIHQNLVVDGNISASGTKNRIVDTSYGKRKLNAVESADAWFQDYGEAKTDNNGVCRIEIDPIFLETVNTDFLYHCFLSPHDDANIYVSRKERDCFIVSGTPNTKFDWCITAKQHGYETIRLEEVNP